MREDKKRERLEDRNEHLRRENERRTRGGDREEGDEARKMRGTRF